MVNNADSRGKNLLTLPVFLGGMVTKALQKTVNTEEEENIREAFQMFDRDNNGIITRTEIKQAMHELGEEMSDADVDHMIREADLNGDWQLDYEEFKAMMLKKK
jgi:Ca2+-binding EF-hand superfamily protein